MKSTYAAGSLLVAAAMIAPAVGRSEESVTNRLTFSARFGFNISARFKGNAGRLSAPGSARTTPGGQPYNYDDGYVLPDISGNYGGQTWYWGYDDSASQISGNNILLNRSTPSGNFSSPSFDNDPSYGGEISYNRQLGASGRLRYGLEGTANYMNLSMSDRSTFSGSASRTTDAYAFTPGTTPPASPFQGTFEGPGFLIGATPVSSTTAVVPGGFTLSGRREFDANLFGGRVGPYLDFPFRDNFNVWVSGGLAFGWLNGEASWAENITLPGGGSARSAGGGSHDDFLLGAYVAANVSWDFYERWSVVGGAQYQYLGDYEHDYGGRTVEVDFGKSFFVTIGLGRTF